MLVRWTWVAGHGTEPEQNRADSLARQAAISDAP